MDPADALLLDCIVFVACGSGGLTLGVLLAHAVPARYVAELLPPKPPEYLRWPHLFPEAPAEDQGPRAWPQVDHPPPGEDLGPLGVLVGGLVLLGILGALASSSRRRPEQ